MATAPAPFSHWRVTAVDHHGADDVTFRKAPIYTVITPDGRHGRLIARSGVYHFVEQLAFFDPMEGFALTAQRPKAAARPTPPPVRGTQPSLFANPRILAGQIRTAPDGRPGVRTIERRHGRRHEVWVIVPEALPDWRTDFASEPRALRRPLAQPSGLRESPLVLHRKGDRRPISRAFLPSGDSVEVAWEIVDLADLITSHDPWTLQVRPEFPAALQPRDRSRKSYQDQIARLVAGFNPELLTWSATASDGAPIIGPHGVVESGNGRTMALSRVYRDGGEKAAAYRQTVAAWGAELGLPPSKARHPVLVRRRLTDLDPAEFARQANVSQMQGMAAAELAIADASTMTANLVHQLEPGAELGTLANARFVEAFIAQVAGRGARGQMLDPRGKLSKEGEIRLDLALFAYAYGPEAQLLITDLAEVRESDLKTVLTAMVTAAPYVARLRADVAGGRYDAQLDPAAELAKFALAVRSSRLANLRLDEFLRQTDAFSAPSDITFVLRDALHPTGARASGRALAAAIVAYVAHARQHPAEQISMFGDATPSQIELWRRALRGPPAEVDA